MTLYSCVLARQLHILTFRESGYQYNSADRCMLKVEGMMIKSGESQPYCHLLVGTIMPLAWDLPWAAGKGGPFMLSDIFFSLLVDDQ